MGQTGQTSQGWETGQTDLTFKLDFPGNLCRAASQFLRYFYLILWSSSFSMRIWVLREIGQLSDILHFSLEMTNHPISFQRGAILPNLDPQNNFPISKCYLYIGFQYVKIETFPKCWRKLKKLTNVNQKTQQVYWRAEISAFLHFWGVSFKTFSLFFQSFVLLKNNMNEKF